MKRTLVLGLAFCVAVGAWAGGGKESSGGQKASSGDQKPLVVWMKKGFVEEQNTRFEAQVKAFAAEKGIPVTVELIAYEDFLPKWTAAVSSGNVPDISFFGYQEVGQFYKQGLLEDITPVLAKIQERNGPIFEGSKKVITFEGKSYALPFWGEGTALYYRKDIFAAAGITNPPDTWDEFKEIAKKTTDPAKNIFGAGIGYGAGNSDAEWLSRSILWAFGGKIFDKSGKLAIDSPQAREAIAYIVSIFNDDKSTPPSAIGWNDAGNNTAYLSGQAAMIFNTGSVVNAMKKNNEDLLKKTGVVALPKGKAGRFTAGISNNLAIFKNAKNKEMAKELLVYLTDPIWYSGWINVSAPLALPVFTRMAKEDPIWKDPYNKAFIDSMSTFAFLGYDGPYTPAAGKVYNLRLINAMFESIIAKKTPVDTAIKDFVTEASKTLN